MVEPSGYIIVDSLHEDWELLELGFTNEAAFPTVELARQHLLEAIHPAYQDNYSIRKIANGKLA